MGLFRRSQSKSQGKQEVAPSQLHRRTGAGRQADINVMQQSWQQQPTLHPPPQQSYYEPPPHHAEETGTRGLGRDSTAHSTQNLYEPAHHAQNNRYIPTNDATSAMILSAFSPDDNGDFDDSASYHSTSSNPGIPLSAATHANDAAYSKTMPSRYLHMAASQGRGTSRNERPAIDSYYSTTGDDNLFRAPENSQSFYDRQQFKQQSPTAAYAGSAIASPESAAARPKPKTAQELGEEYFHMAVAFHEQGDLVSATAYFKRAADKHNPLGMLFYGLSLRHGWGCQPNENLAFVFLQKAGEQVVPRVRDMDPAAAGIAREELAMAIYELGQSYRHGWGVSRNKKTAAYYFEVAADLGDADAQADLAACYEKGDGVKRDMKRAAHYYRLAHKQGIEMFGTSWIFKKKYDSD
ncbi:hypothetical protein IW140_001096 [Coemansia sp. RSA 1813]|nr:hypothetical protein LPJ74_000867 [Coemansia sp. RSA 1843]KAJ2092005.1 hypothetical protein IW138_001371 [Coemansia sp. RSA 986]KAJ2216658.1 hypothetical protein EV179_001197 [Coemansia sp. RSA 487]KAJ2572056.1 hypothetical protein IW140_001096 [Coemansia sp. RSA 1813]